MVQTRLIGERGALTLLDAFEGRRMLIAYYFMWHTGHPAPEQCEGCTWFTSQVLELSYIHARDVWALAAADFVPAPQRLVHKRAGHGCIDIVPSHERNHAPRIPGDHGLSPLVMGVAKAVATDRL
jgi:predicted dithiol-disulfide oxidoreductase (DUF899 family)